MKIRENFLITNKRGLELYWKFAHLMPIYDYHCHLPPQEIAENRVFPDLTSIWLDGDHYKWRAMRANGISEELITGSATQREKHDAWSYTVPYTLRNPLYHWSHLELERYFGIGLSISEWSAEPIWEQANARLHELSVHRILDKFDVRMIGTTDDPADPLTWHEKISQSGIRTKVYPAYRPDAAFGIQNPNKYRQWIEKLGNTWGSSISNFDDLLQALKQRHADFHAMGCRLSDHGLPHAYAEECTHAQASSIFAKVLGGQEVSPEDRLLFGSYLMFEFAQWDAEKGWVKQLHLGPIRNTNSAAVRMLGPDTGFDSIGDYRQVDHLQKYLDRLESMDRLPKMVIYNNNPNDNYLFATMAGNFQKDVPGKIQFGSGWWYLDQKEGIEWQLNALSNCGLLRRFVGMLTDSRSFLSYPRHEYFRRVLCNILGAEMERGELPDEEELIGKMVREICYENARSFFGMEVAV